jgi:peptidoglycan/LPS O-acetylase OafA/YrhL
LIPTVELTTASATRPLSPTASAHLNLARGLAAAAVAFQHLRALLLLDWPRTTTHSYFAGIFYFLAKFGHPAVIVFFVLSGFLVGSSGLRAIENRTWSFPRYLLHRFLRLEIVLLPALLLSLLWDSVGIHLLGASTLYNGGWHLVVRPGPIDLSWRTLLGNAAFVQDILVTTFGTNGPLWSLSYEFWYYVLFGLLATAALRTARLWLRLLIAVLVIVVAWFTGFAIMSLAPLWFLGLGIYLLPRKNLSHRARLILLAASILLFLTFLGLTFGRRAPVEIPTQPLMIDLVTGILFSLVLYATLHANPARPRYRQIAHHIAAPTYTLYANHMPAMTLLLAWLGVRQPPTPARCLELLGWFLVFWLYAYGLYLLFESRTPTIRNWIEPKLFTPPSGSASRCATHPARPPLP